MGEEDRNQIVGSLAIRLAEARREHTFIKEELSRVANDVSALVETVRSRSQESFERGGTIQLLPYAQKYLDLTKLLALLARQTELGNEVALLRQKLNDLGA